MKKKLPVDFLKNLAKRQGLVVVLSLACLGLVFLAGTFWLEKQDQAATISRLDSQRKELSKQVTSLTDFKPIKGSFVPPLRSSDRVEGSRDAEILIIEYSDLECPFCKQLNASLLAIQKEFGTKVAHVFRQFPISALHANAPMEAEAAECVGEQAGDKGFYTFINAVFAGSSSNGTSYTEVSIQTLAGTLGFDSTKLKECMASDTKVAAVNATYKEAKDLGMTGTPTWFIIRTRDNDTRQAIGTKKTEVIREVINQLLSQG